MSFSRPLCPMERYYLAYHEICPDFVLQFFFDGRGVLDLPRWKEAVSAASLAHPGSRLVLKGSWMFSRWVDSGKTPRVREVDGSSWDGLSSEGGPAFLREPFDPWEGPVCEVLLIQGNPLRVGFRGHHGVMDGRGILIWAEDVFRALRGEAPIGSDSRIIEYELARSFQKNERTPLPHEFIAPTGMPGEKERGIEWRRMRIPGRYENLLGRVAVLLAQAARQHDEGKVCFAVPVDLRARKPGLRSIGNLANLVYLHIDPGTTARDAAQDLARQLRDKNDGLQYWADRLIRYVPMNLLHNSIVKEMDRIHVKGRYRNSGILSNVGRFPLEYYHGGGFTSEYFWGIPPGNETLPIFMGILYSDEDTTLIPSVPKPLASGGRLDALVEYLRKGLASSSGPGREHSQSRIQ